MKDNNTNHAHPLRAIFNRMDGFETEKNIARFQDKYGNVWPLFKFSIYQSYTLRYLNKNSFYHRITKFISKRKPKYKDALKEEVINETSMNILPNNTISEIWISHENNRKSTTDRYNKFIDPYYYYLAKDDAMFAEYSNNSKSENYFHPILKNKTVHNLSLSLNALSKELRLKSPQVEAASSFFITINKFKLINLKKAFPELNIISAVYEYEVFKF